MPEKKTTQRARRAMKKGKSPTTAAGEFVHEEIHHVRRGKHGAKSTKQAIAIGLSKARRAGVPVPARGRAAAKKRSEGPTRKKPSTRRSRASRAALKKQGGKRVVSKKALSRQAKTTMRRRKRAA
jgi:hypothetical protein